VGGSGSAAAAEGGATTVAEGNAAIGRRVTRRRRLGERQGEVGRERWERGEGREGVVRLVLKREGPTRLSTGRRDGERVGRGWISGLNLTLMGQVGWFWLARLFFFFFLFSANNFVLNTFLNINIFLIFKHI
jgi:hypothetical protein